MRSVIFSGVLASLGSILAMAVLFGFTHQEYVSFLPKSITTAIGMGISEELGGYVSITVAIIVLTGVLGNMCAESVCSFSKSKNLLPRVLPSALLPTQSELPKLWSLGILKAQ